MWIPHFQYFSDDHCLSIKQCMIYEDQDTAFRIQDAKTAVNAAINCSDMEFLRWLYEHRRQLFEPDVHLNHAIRRGNLLVVEWLHARFPDHSFADPNQSFQKLCKDSDCKFLHERRYVYTFDVVLWVVCDFDWANEDKRVEWMRDGISCTSWKAGTADIPV